MRLHEGDEKYVPLFFKTFKENFAQATVIWIIYAIIIAIVAFLLMNGYGVISVIPTALLGIAKPIGYIIGIPLLMSILYIFGILGRFANSTKKIIRNSFLLSIQHMDMTVKMILMIVAVGAANFLGITYRNDELVGSAANSFTTALIVIDVILFGMLGYIFAGFYSKMSKNYIPGEAAYEANVAAVEAREEKARQKKERGEKIKAMKDAGASNQEIMDAIRSGQLEEDKNGQD